MAGYAQTVTGIVPVEALGATLMHEHILCDLRAPSEDPSTGDAPITMANRFETDYFQNRNPANMVLDEDDVALHELRDFKAAGGGTIVELTIGGLVPQPLRLAALSESAGISVVMGAGYYVDAYLSDTIRAADIDELEQQIETQLTDGAWGTGVRAGVIGEIGCSWPLAASERRILEAAVRVQRSTGAALTIHPGRDEDAPAEIARIVANAGADPSRTIFCHMDRTIFDRGRLVELLDQGFVLEWDFFGIETSQYWMAGVDLDLPTDYMRLDLIGDLMAMGYRQQIAISQDICTRTRLTSYGGHGYAHLLRHVAPLMRRRGWRDSDIDQLLVKTPARLLGFHSGPVQS
ncbi:MAG: aryldialkylphosphatase [Hyphomicrobiales bacterium]|nr:aryldialkylphosphatase [Hyphomicrobiales bacterium]